MSLSDYSQLSDFIVRLQPYTILSENKAVNTPIKFEKIVMVMIKNDTKGRPYMVILDVDYCFILIW